MLLFSLLESHPRLCMVGSGSDHGPSRMHRPVARTERSSCPCPLLHDQQGLLCRSIQGRVECLRGHRANHWKSAHCPRVGGDGRAGTNQDHKAQSVCGPPRVVGRSVLVALDDRPRGIFGHAASFHQTRSSLAGPAGGDRRRPPAGGRRGRATRGDATLLGPLQAVDHGTLPPRARAARGRVRGGPSPRPTERRATRRRAKRATLTRRTSSAAPGLLFVKARRARWAAAFCAQN